MITPKAKKAYDKAYYLLKKEEILKKTAEYRARPGHKEKFNKYRRGWAYMKKYGITVEEFESILAKQGYVCAICRKDGKFVVDHDHNTLKVRGVLCGHCNKALGMMFDDTTILANAIEYLKWSR